MSKLDTSRSYEAHQCWEILLSKLVDGSCCIRIYLVLIGLVFHVFLFFIYFFLALHGLVPVIKNPKERGLSSPYILSNSNKIPHHHLLWSYSSLLTKIFTLSYLRCNHVKLSISTLKVVSNTEFISNKYASSVSPSKRINIVILQRFV